MELNFDMSKIWVIWFELLRQSSVKKNQWKNRGGDRLDEILFDKCQINATEGLI